MIPQKQKIFDNNTGDCFRACMASILEIPNDESLPHIDKKTWLGDWMNWLEKRGLRLGMDHKAIWREGYWIATVPSKNFKGLLHAIVMKDFKVAFDPSTHKRYRTGRNMAGTNLVSEGNWIEISDMSLFKKYLKGEKE